MLYNLVYKQKEALEFNSNASLKIINFLTSITSTQKVQGLNLVIFFIHSMQGIRERNSLRD